MDLNTTGDICRKCWENLETVQHKISSCHALAQGDYAHHSQVATIVYEELAIKCGLSKRRLMTYYKYEPHSMLENSNYQLYYDKSNKNWTIYKNRPDIVLLDKTIKEAFLTDLAISKSQLSQHYHQEAPEIYDLK
jgi:hypothetical protein